MADSISAIPQQPFLGRLAEFLRFLEKDRPEFLPRQLGVMQGISQLALPQASTIENLSYGNQPFTMPPSGTGAMIPQVKTGRKAEVADLVSMISGVPGGRAVADVGTKLSNEAADALVRAITRNPQATAPGVIQETSMPFMQAVAPRTPGLLQTPVKSDLGFYSALEQATTPLQNKGTGQQFLAQIEKTAGVKPEEIKWTGLDDFLKSRQNVTKQEVQDYLAANRVNLQEVRLREPDAEDVRLFMQDEAGRGYDYEDALDYLRGTQDSPKFSSYTLPGGENYREILLTLPEKTRPVSLAEVNAERAKISPLLEPISQTQYDDLVKSGEVGRVGLGGQQYRSSHYPDYPNPLAHMRANDRVIDGKKTLFIEEIQSDWHQAGRKKGYVDKDKPWEVFDPVTANVVGRYASEGEATAAKLELNKAGGMFDIGKSEGVPDAPFKTSWHELSLKRAIQEASEKGYDKIAFTTGKTQAERYDLSKQVNKIDVEAVDEVPNLYFVDVDVAGRGKMNLEVENGVVRQGEFEGKPLEDVVGKEIAEKVFAVQQGQTTRLQGDDLRIGGEGMKGFYDQILPKSLEKLGKKFDAKVAKTTMDGTEVWSMDITPKMRESIVTKGQPLFAATPAVGLLGDENE